MKSMQLYLGLLVSGSMFLAVASPVAAAIISFDAASSGSSFGASSTTFSHTVGTGMSNQDLLVVGVALEDNAANTLVDTVTYGGVGLEKIISNTYGGGRTTRSELWYLLDPVAGTADVVVTYNTTPFGEAVGAVSVDNVLQQGPEVFGGTQLESANSISTTVTTLTDGAWLFDVTAHGAQTSLTPGGSQVKRWQAKGYSVGNNAVTGAGSTLLAETAGTVSTGWTTSPEGFFTHSVAAFAPAPVPEPASLVVWLLLGGIGLAVSRRCRRKAA